MAQTPSANDPSGWYSPVPPAPPWAKRPSARAEEAVPRRIAGWRRVLSIGMMITGCVLAPLALLAVWVHADLMTVNGYVETIAPVAAEATVQKAVADVLARQISAALDDAESWSLPKDASSATSAVSEGLGTLTSKLALQAVQDPAFEELWAEANRKIHPLIVAAIRRESDPGRSDVALDLGRVTAVVTDLLAEARVALPKPLPKALRSSHVRLLASEPLRDAGAVLVVLDRLSVALVAGALAGLMGGVVLAGDRRRAAVYAGAGLALAMVALHGARWAGRRIYLGAADDAGIPHDASVAVWNVVTSDLGAWAWVVLAAGAGAAAALLLLARRRRPA